MARKQPFQNILIITGVIAAVSVVATIYAYWGTSSFLTHSKSAKGEIIGFQKQRKIFKPIIEFFTEKGEKVQFIALMGSKDTTQVKTGSKVKVLYHPANPQENVVLEDFWQIWFPPMMILLFGVAPFLFVLVLKFILMPSSKPA